MNKKIIVLSTFITPILTFILLKNVNVNILDTIFILLCIAICIFFLIAIFNFIYKKQHFGKTMYFLSLKKQNNIINDFVLISIIFLNAIIYKNIYIIGILLMLITFNFYMYIIRSKKNNYSTDKGFVINGMFIKWIEISNIQFNYTEITISFKFKQLNKFNIKTFICYTNQNEENDVKNYINERILPHSK